MTTDVRGYIFFEMLKEDEVKRERMKWSVCPGGTFGGTCLGETRRGASAGPEWQGRQGRQVRAGIHQLPCTGEVRRSWTLGCPSPGRTISPLPTSLPPTSSRPAGHHQHPSSNPLPSAPGTFLLCPLPSCSVGRGCGYSRGLISLGALNGWPYRDRCAPLRLVSRLRQAGAKYWRQSMSSRLTSTAGVWIQTAP